LSLFLLSKLPKEANTDFMASGYVLLSLSLTKLNSVALVRSEQYRPSDRRL
jgi:hypothetical protein